jgi:resuscitation-promoting factor RpfA
MTQSLAAPSPSAPTSGSTATVRSARQAPRQSAANPNRAKRGDRTHVVAPGESLWSIADDLLGDDASVARVAREVNRLWELNARRIGTGDPSLVHVGTTLLL